MCLFDCTVWTLHHDGNNEIILISLFDKVCWTHHRRLDAIPSRLPALSCSFVAICSSRRRWYWRHTLPPVAVFCQDVSDVGTGGRCMSLVLRDVVQLLSSIVCDTVSSHPARLLFTGFWIDFCIRRSFMKRLLHTKHYTKLYQKYAVIFFSHLTQCTWNTCTVKVNMNKNSYVLLWIMR